MSSAAEILLAEQLRGAGIEFETEYRFAPPRRWRADAVVFGRPLWVGGDKDGAWRTNRILVEIDGGGYISGRHSRGRGMEQDAEKASAAAILGYRIIRATPAQVEDGRCLAWIRAALGVDKAA